MCVKPNHVNINIKTVLKFWFRVAWAHLEDNPEFKTGDTAKFRQHISKWADWTYSRKFGETIDAVDDNHGGGRSESAAPKKRLRICDPNDFQPKKDESNNRDDDNRDDYHDSDDKESEKTLILGAD